MEGDPGKKEKRTKMTAEEINQALEESLNSERSIDGKHFQNQNAFEDKLEELITTKVIKEKDKSFWREKFDIPPPREEKAA